MAAPAAPQIGVQNGTREMPHFVFTTWCIIQLMRVAPTRFPHCNFDTSPPELDAYEFFHAFTILRWAHTVLSLRENPSPKVRPASPVMWHRKPEVPTLPDSANTLEPRNALSATSGGDNIGFPRERALSDCLGAREMLYQFAGKLCEQFQHFPGIDGLVEKYAHTIELSYVGAKAANGQALVQLASHCAQMGNQSARETGRGEEVGPDQNTGPGVKHSGTRFQAASRTQISRWNNGVSKSRTRPSKVRNTGSNERIQGVFNSALAGTFNSPDRWDTVKSNATIELYSVIEVDLTED
ncbi:hypothetical protein PENPOL_c004G05019 [Penicillium polonicum]|uniref:Uncharacterized protein n=1 Tax=Penicillium polonicum TaxID=60169 RepID=A0A1V6NPC6_PENPO|nr:hypothetical protein PENPOL_c004G05019 [Penicillium polonicum]